MAHGYNLGRGSANWNQIPSRKWTEHAILRAQDVSFHGIKRVFMLVVYTSNPVKQEDEAGGWKIKGQPEEEEDREEEEDDGEEREDGDEEEDEEEG